VKQIVKYVVFVRNIRLLLHSIMALSPRSVTLAALHVKYLVLILHVDFYNTNMLNEEAIDTARFLLHNVVIQVLQSLYSRRCHICSGFFHVTMAATAMTEVNHHSTYLSGFNLVMSRPLNIHGRICKTEKSNKNLTQTRTLRISDALHMSRYLSDSTC
jgi:hypothetical protein